LKKTSIISLFIFLIAALSLTGAYFYFLQRTKASISEHERLKTEIRALEATEQRLILVKDRLTKIESVYGTNDAEEEISAFETVSSFATEGVFVNDLDIQKDSLAVSLTASSLSELTRFTGNLVRLGGFNKIILNSMEFDPEEGYVVSLSAI
jgi:Tfp pilus assembly protein PilN